MKKATNSRIFRAITITFLAVLICTMPMSVAFGTQCEPQYTTLNLMDDILAPFEELITNGGIFSPENNPYGFRYYYNVGSNKNLEGSPYIAVFFIDDDESSWGEASVSTFYNKLVVPSVEFLEDNAADYNVSLDMKIGYFATYVNPDMPIRYNGIVEPNRDTSASWDMVDQAAASLGYASKEEMHAALQEYSGEEEIIYVFMLNKAGQTHASIYGNSPAVHDYDGQLFEFCVIYTGFEDGVYNVGSEAVAHEILHLYGAEDYYTPEERYVIASMFCPNDIMLCAQSNIEDFEVGELTAYSVGWFDIVPAVFGALS